MGNTNSVFVSITVTEPPMDMSAAALSTGEDGAAVGGASSPAQVDDVNSVATTGATAVGGVLLTTADVITAAHVGESAMLTPVPALNIAATSAQVSAVGGRASTNAAFDTSDAPLAAKPPAKLLAANAGRYYSSD